jgi:hypothetical protein
MAIEVKIEMRHDVRNMDADVSSIEEKICDDLNLHNDDMVESVRFGGGRSAGALFVELNSDYRFRVNDSTANLNLERIVERSVHYAELFNYAENISSPYFSVTES